MNDVEFLRKLADEFGVAAAWGEHAPTCKRLREIANKLDSKRLDRECVKCGTRWQESLYGLHCPACENSPTIETQTELVRLRVWRNKAMPYLSILLARWKEHTVSISKETNAAIADLDAVIRLGNTEK